MKLKSITLYGFYGFTFEHGITIENFEHRNIFIGPNNSGKSTVFRFLHLLKASIETTKFELFIDEPIDHAWWWQHDTSKTITATVIFTVSRNDCKISEEHYEKLIVNGEFRTSVSILAAENDKCKIVISPYVNINDSLLPVIKVDPTQPTRLLHLNLKGEYILSRAKDACIYHEPATVLLKTWAKCVKFFDPVRAIDRASGNRGMEDGSSLLARLFEQQHATQQAANHKRFTTRLLDKINKLLATDNDTYLHQVEVKGSKDRPRMFFHSKAADSVPISIENMGTGIAELTILISSLVYDSDRAVQYFIEEPEIHLHPGLLRRLMHLLADFTNIQFFISSHSNVVLDSLDTQSKIFRFAQLSNGACHVFMCKELIDQYHLLDSLGVSGSTLLQTNCVIWVEGPSDRIYLRLWIQQLDPHLYEGSDYSFAFYGGKVLSHFAFDAEDTDIDDLVSLLKISRFSAVVIDKDLAPTEDGTNLRSTKQRIQQEAYKDPIHRKVYLTSGREIENDVDTNLFVPACATLLGIDVTLLSNLGFKQINNYPKEIVEHLGLNIQCDKGRTFYNKLRDKTELARKVVEISKSGLDDTQLPIYAEELVEFIRSSRVSSTAGISNPNSVLTT